MKQEPLRLLFLTHPCENIASVRSRFSPFPYASNTCQQPARVSILQAGFEENPLAIEMGQASAEEGDNGSEPARAFVWLAHLTSFALRGPGARDRERRVVGRGHDQRRLRSPDLQQVRLVDAEVKGLAPVGVRAAW